MAACPDLSRDPVAAQLGTVSLQLPTVAARLAVVDPEVHLQKDEYGPGRHPGKVMEVRSVRLPTSVAREILEGLQFTRGEGAELWTAVHRQPPDEWHRNSRPPGRDPLVGVEWRVRRQ